jgi:outer membrane murein-binding lipoprotein Lpp
MKRFQKLGLIFVAACLPFGTARAETPVPLQAQIDELRTEIKAVAVLVDTLDKKVEEMRAAQSRDTELSIKVEKGFSQEIADLKEQINGLKNLEARGDK